ncbi:IS30 family transposase [Kribbella deserti]|uniref:IS30 family transposase n=1 Tax=Kribbella deserti TaxID=1926257 RepID=A0ABV6QRD3_9ACTN
MARFEARSSCPAEKPVAHETTFQALYIQGRGELRRQLAEAVRTGRTYVTDRPGNDASAPPPATEEILISGRPAVPGDRALPGHWESDLILGRRNTSAIGTLVERATRYVMLLHLPHGRTAEQVRDALAATAPDLPAHLARSLGENSRGDERARVAFTVSTALPVYFCDPESPWLGGSNESTNGLLRQYFPKDADLAVHSREHLDAVGVQLNGRPRKTLGWETPAERLQKLLAT